MTGDQERLIVMLEARISDFEKKMQRAERRGTTTYTGLSRNSRRATRQMEADMNRSSASINRAVSGVSMKIGSFGKALAGGLIGGAIAAAFAGLSSNISETVRGIAEIGDEAKRSGLSLQSFQEWKFVAEQNRIAVDSLTDGFKELSLRADEFVTTGQGSAAQSFQRLGFSATDLKKRLKDPSKLMLEIVKRMQSFDKAAQIRIADEVFGGTGGERFVALLAKGDGELRKTIARAHDVGAVLDDEMVQKAAEIDRKFQELTTRVGQFGKKLAVALADVPFDAFNTRLDEMFKDEGQGRSVLGDNVFDELSKAGALTDEQVRSVEDLRNGYQGLEEDARGMSMQLASAAGMADQLGNDALWSVLATASKDMRDVADEFAAGTINGDDFAKKLDVIQGNANDALSELQGIDAQGFGGVISQLGSLGKAITALLPKAHELRKALPGGTPGMDTGTGMTVADIQLPGTPLAPTSSPRPTSTPFTGDVVTPSNFKPSSSSGGGAGSRDGFKAAIDQIAQETVALQAEAQALLEAANSGRDYGDAQEYARVKAKLLAAAQKEGKAVTPELAAQIDTLALSYAKAGDAADDAADKLTRAKEQSQQGADAISGIFEAALQGADSAREAVANLLLEIAKAQLDKSIAGMAGSGGGFFGFLGGLLGGFATGGYTGDGDTNQPAGVVHRGEYVFSKKATQAIGSGNLEAMHQRAKRGYVSGGNVGSAGGSAASAGTMGVDVNVTVDMDQNGNWKAYVDQSATKISQQHVSAFNKALPDRVQQISRNPRVR
ncbi:hypothetical protein DL1_11380 [Thioclava dalianensis]|uniref:Tail tape measure protein n=1 Tax=Thioclava dalianensis TaxID=1185766 RepID=A0A074T9N9_9RHOB|nr:hypothetical protein DL1_11380 [Thioclava dalianensis]